MQKLTELVDSFQVYGLCLPCGRMEALPLRDLIARHGPAITVADVRNRLCCRCCGQRSYELRVIYVGPEGAASSFRYRR
jgi:hypothetical protein